MAGACVPFEKTSPFWGTIGAGFGGEEATSKIGREYADKLPYASMLAWFKGSPKALLVLAEIDAQSRWIWHSAERQSVVTYGPFVVGLLGVDIELRGTRLQGAWSRNPAELVGKRLSRLLDIEVEGSRTQLLLESQFALAGVRTIEIEGKTYTAHKIEETVRSQGRARYKNEYWVEVASGRCWKSRQTAVPTLPTLSIEVLKYPSS